jgi:hypothetical protein
MSFSSFDIARLRFLQLLRAPLILNAAVMVNKLAQKIYG